MKCDLCRNDEAVAGQLLCPVCQEAILRLATAAKAAAEQAKPASVNPLPIGNRGPAHFKLAAGVGAGKPLSTPTLVRTYKPKADRWSEESLPDFTD